MVFELDKHQLKKLQEWQDEHLKDEAYTGAIGARFIYSFVPTSLGMIVRVTDDVTKAVIDLTDYESW